MLFHYLFYCFTVDLKGVPEKTTASKMFNVLSRNLIDVFFIIEKGLAMQDCIIAYCTLRLRRNSQTE